MRYFFPSRKGSAEHLHRVADITDQINKTGLYNMTYDELDFGAKTAWRNAPRCIGRIQWNNLKVLSSFHAFSASKMKLYIYKVHRKCKPSFNWDKIQKEQIMSLPLPLSCQLFSLKKKLLS